MQTRTRRLESYFSKQAPLYQRLYAGRAGPLARRWWRPLVLYKDRTLGALPEVRGKSVLEIGSGTGSLAIALAQRGASVLGLDLCPTMVEIARGAARDLGVVDRAEFRVFDFGREPLQIQRRFDYVVAMTVFDYCDDPHQWLRTISSAGDRLIATFPLRAFWPTLARRAHALMRGRAHGRFYTEASVREHLQSTGFRIVSAHLFGSTLWIDAQCDHRASQSSGCPST